MNYFWMIEGCHLDINQDWSKRQEVFLSLKGIQKGKALHITTHSRAKQSPNRVVKDENINVEQREWVTEAETSLGEV